MRFKKCPKCKQVKSEEFFNGRKRKYLNPYCIPCTSEHGRERYIKNAEDLRRISREYHSSHKKERNEWRLRHRYGIGSAEVEKMLLDQNGRCANLGCAVLLTKERGKTMLHVDHDHETSKVRGLLCNNCNVALGAVNDDRRKILGLVTYLNVAESVRFKDGLYLSGRKDCDE